MSKTIDLKDGWSREFPSKEGLFWFYGESNFGAMGGHFTGSVLPEPRFILVKIHKITNGLMAVGDGRFLPTDPFCMEGQSSGYLGFWKDASLPDGPLDAFNEIYEKEIKPNLHER
jgi:hypothetical protein